MAAVTVRNLSAETHRALKAQAAQHGRSTEAEIRIILENAVRPEQRLRMGDALAALGRRFNVKPDEFQFERDKSDAEPINFK